MIEMTGGMFLTILFEECLKKLKHETVKEISWKDILTESKFFISKDTYNSIFSDRKRLISYVKNIFSHEKSNLDPVYGYLPFLPWLNSEFTVSAGLKNL